MTQLVLCCQDLGALNEQMSEQPPSLRCCFKSDFCLAETDFYIDVISFNVFKPLCPGTTC